MTEHPTTSSLRGKPRGARGLVLLALLLALMLGSIVLMGAVELWASARQRAREQDLLFVGDQYRQAIRLYYFGAPPGSPRVLPSRLEDLLEDSRYPLPVRYLRRLYPDPMTGETEWGLVRAGDRIAGVYSLSDKTPRKQAGFPPDYQTFSGKTSYREWTFVVPPASGGLPLLGAGPAGTPLGDGGPTFISRPIAQNPS